jgi:hypothetical protein
MGKQKKTRQKGKKERYNQEQIKEKIKKFVRDDPSSRLTRYLLYDNMYLSKLELKVKRSRVYILQYSEFKNLIH